MRRALSGILLLSALAAAAVPRFTIDQERGEFQLDGKPFQVISGEMHYLRIPPEYWRDRLRMARGMGLNTITTYVFWNAHEPRPGEFNFSGGADLAKFIRTAQEEGLFVIVRPGPYACAEWEFGGYPAWLLKEHDLVVRSMDERYLKASQRYFERLGKEIAPLQSTHGGPVIMVQFENEYGSFGSDKVYLGRVYDMLRQAGIDVPLFTSDGAVQMPRGYLPQALPAINGSVGQEIIDTISKFRPKGPYFVAEYYPGWLDHWGEPHAHVEIAKNVGEMEWILSHGISMNFYMFHGGTNFGFMNGANYSDHYQPQPSSYDYEAPLDEAGRPTAKYKAFREVIAKYAKVPLPEIPAGPKMIAVPRFELKETASLLSVLPKAVRSERPLSMEDIGQNYGYILYRTRVAKAVEGMLAIKDLRDYGIVIVNGKPVASLDRRRHEDSVNVSIPAGATLEILVENGGRINYGPEIPRNRKGITESVTLSGEELKGWEIFPLPLERIPALRAAKMEVTGPRYVRGSFAVSETGDTFLDMRGWGKGCVFVNGRNLGRFWHIGPQQTVFLPGVWMKKGANEIVVVQLENGPQRSIEGLRDPILNELEPEKK